MNSFPAIDAIPAPNAQFRSLYDFSTVIEVPVNRPFGLVGIPVCNASDPINHGPTGSCGWVCDVSHCERPSDISQCPSKGQWGLSVLFFNQFDDGPSPYTPRLLDYLATKGIKATFFLVGSRVKQFPEMALRIFREGHEIGYFLLISVHTWSHRALTTLTTDQVIAELEYTSRAIEQVIGTRPLVMRPPFGDFGMLN